MRLIHVQHPISFVSIRVHSWFKTATPFVSIRGSKHPLIRAHSCPFVVQNTTSFVSIRGSKPYSIRGYPPPIRNHPRLLIHASLCLAEIATATPD